MKRFMAMLMAAFMLLMLPGEAEAASDYSWIKVKLSTNNATVITMYASGRYFIKENGAEFTGGTVTVKSNGDGTMTLYHSSYGSGLYTGKEMSIMRASVDRNAGYMKLNSRTYLGHFNLKVMSSGYIRVVNELPLAHYLYGVVGYEMNDTFPLETLKAQAIAAKCYVLSGMNPTGDYYIGDTSSEQVYKGYNASYTNVISAVDSTLTEVLTVGGQLLRTYFAASNGGETLLPTQAWPSKSVSNSGYDIRLDPYDIDNVYSKTEVIRIPVNMNGEVSQSVMNLLINKASAALGYNVTQIDAIQSVDLHTPKYSGTSRCMTKCTIRLTASQGGSNQGTAEFTFNTSEFESYGAVKDTTLRSYWGEMDSSGYYKIYHVRYGHGVGLSQRGAQTMGNKGMSYKQILEFYYPGATLSNISVSTPQDPVNSASSGEAGQTAATPNPTQEITAPDGVVAVGVVNGSNVNLRTGPGTSHDSIDKLARNTELNIYGSIGGWYMVTTSSGQSGYMISTYVSITGYPTRTAAPEATPSGTNAPEAMPEAAAVPTPTPTPAPAATEKPAEDTVQVGRVTTSGVNLRVGPRTSYSSMGKLKKDTGVYILGTAGEWYGVQAGSQKGYVHGKYIEITGTRKLDSGAGKGVTTGSVRLREGTGTSTKIIDTLKKGTEITIYGEQDGWYSAKTADGKKGYVSSKYVKVTEAYTGTVATETETKTEQKQETTIAIGKGKTTTNVNFRQGPSSSTKKLARLAKGTEVTLIASDGDWYLAKHNDIQGYIYAKYIKIETTNAQSTVIGGESSAESTGQTKGAEAETAESAVSGSGITLPRGAATEKVNFRSGPNTSGTKVYTTLKKGTEVEVIGSTGDWYYVIYDGKVGFISAKYLSLTKTGSVAVQRVSSSISPQNCVTNSEVNIRSGPSTSTEKLGRLSKGQQVTVFYVSDGWCFADCGKQYGFLYDEYVSLKN